jgi:hypothetical protein
MDFCMAPVDKTVPDYDLMGMERGVPSFFF